MGLFVTAQGTPLLVSPGTTGSQLAQLRHLDPRPGAKLDIAGDVRSPGTAHPGSVEVLNSEDSPNAVLRHGAELVAVEGRAIIEKVTRKSEDIPFQTVTEGEGSVVVLAQRGEPGVRETLVGVGSKRTGAKLVAKDPVNTVIRRTSGLASGQRAAALTFDDGPDTATPQILTILAQKGVPATFFVLGGNASALPNMIEKIRAGGHEIANHTWSHPDLTRLNAEAIKKELSRTSDLLGGCAFLRPLRQLQRNGYHCGRGVACAWRWDVDTRDWRARTRMLFSVHFMRRSNPGP